MEDPYAVLSRILESPLERPFHIAVESTHASTLTVTADDHGYVVEHSNRASPVRRWPTVPETVRAVVDSTSVGRIRKLTLRPKGGSERCQGSGPRGVAAVDASFPSRPP
jgi:hypothetical protein